MKKTLLYIIIALVVIGGVWWLMGHEAKAPSETSPTPTVSVSPSTSPTASPRPTATAQANITITSPKAGAVVSSPLTVTGKARIFENQFSAAITTMDGHVIVKKESIMSDAKDSGQFGNYSVTFDIPSDAPSDIKVVVFALSPKGDGSYEGYAEVAVHLKGILIHVNQ